MTMTGAENEATVVELPTELAVMNNGRKTPIPDTNIADTQESDTHFDVTTDDAETRTAGLG